MLILKKNLFRKLMTTKRFFVKANYGNFSVVDINSGKMIVAYNTKRGADATSNGLNKIKTEIVVRNEIKNTIGPLRQQLIDNGAICQSRL